MSLFNTLNTGITGLGTNGLSLSVIGDNISNLNTVGYKGSTADFQDLILQQLGGGRGQLGQGAFTGKVSQVFGQGALENSSNGTDLAIDGKGFFVVADGEGQQFFSRAGQFRLDTEGNLLNVAGLKLQGYQMLADGTLGSTVGDINIPTDPIPGTASENVAVTLNLSPDAEVGTAPTLPATLSEVNDAASFTTSSVVYDSLGRAHDVTLAYFNQGGGDWTFSAYVDAGDTGGTPGDAVEISTGDLDFDGEGNLDPVTSSTLSNAVTFDGADAQTVVFDFGLTTGQTGSVTQYAGTSSLYNIDPDGNGSGNLASFDISNEGVVTGIYSNGDTRELGQVVLANFRSESGLTRVGHNMYGATRESGAAIIGDADSGGRGVIHAYALEMSNVDLENQFVKMIQSQKGYQASARVVSSADELLQELMQIV